MHWKKEYVQTLRCRATRESLCANGSVLCTAAETIARTKLGSFVRLRVPLMSGFPVLVSIAAHWQFLSKRIQARAHTVYTYTLPLKHTNTYTHLTTPIYQSGKPAHEGGGALMSRFPGLIYTYMYTHIHKQANERDQKHSQLLLLHHYFTLQLL